MSKVLSLGAMMLALAIFGCGPSEESKSAQDTTQTTTEKATETAKSAVGEVKKMATAAADKAVEIEKQPEPVVKEAAEETKAMAVAAAKQAVSPETLVLVASYGNVTFPHALHSGEYDCTTCHGEGSPGLFGLDKEKAHVLCKDCHKQKGAGPTGCKNCHEK